MYIKLIKEVLSYIIIVTNIHQYNKQHLEFCWHCNGLHNGFGIYPNK